MSIDATPTRSTTPEAIDHHVSFVGGTAAVTKVSGTGPGVTVKYISTGVVDVAWIDNPGTYEDHSVGLQATTQSQLAGFSVVAGVFDQTNKKVRLNIFNASQALTDLAALQWLRMCFTFKRSGAAV